MNCYNQFVISIENVHVGAALKSQLRDFLCSSLHQLKNSKIWRRALVVAIVKPMKPVGDPKIYRPISLLCVSYKIVGRLIYARVGSPLLPSKQAGFRHGKSTVNHVILLTENIDNFLSICRSDGGIMTLSGIVAGHESCLRLLPDNYTVQNDHGDCPELLLLVTTSKTRFSV